MDSSMLTLLTIFIIVSSVAIVIQAVVLIALYMSVKKSSARMESLADEVQRRALPTLEAAQSLIVDSRSKIYTVMDNVMVTTTMLRGQMERMDATVTDILDRTRLQVIRADELVSRTMDRVEETTEMVQHTVISPVRQLSAVLQGVTAGFGALFMRNRRARREHAPNEEMFI